LPPGIPGRDADPEAALGETVLRQAFARVVNACGYHGIQRADAEDLAQDLFVWLLDHRDRWVLLEGAALAGAIRIYLMRYRRRTHRQRLREGAPLNSDFDPRGSSEPLTDETALSVRSLEKLLPGTEARVLRHLRGGATWAEAVSAVGVPPGSRDWLRKRMAGHVRAAFAPRHAETVLHRDRSPGRVR
jgi:DNA-directed RNA polymerase specialized sigma24 family protein